MNTIIYRDVPGFPGYQAGSDGTVWGTKKSSTADTRGWWHRIKGGSTGKSFAVRLYHGKTSTTTSVGRIILLTFIGPCPDGMEACHNDGDNKNNQLSNLRWDTHEGNMSDQIKHGTRAHGETQGQVKTNTADVREMRRVFDSKTASVRMIAKKYRLHPSTVWAIVSRQSWRHVE